MGLARVSHDDTWLYVAYDDGTTERFLGAWLRDNVNSGRHQHGGLRTFDINFLPQAIITNAERHAEGVSVLFQPEGVSETFDETWLRSHGLQLLHCLVNDSDGGENQLCNGFSVADTIRRQHPEAFDLLTRCPVRFRFVEGGLADLEAA